MSSTVIGAAVGSAALLLAAAVFASVFNTYVLSVAHGLREAAEAAAYLSSATAQLANLTVNGSLLAGVIEATGSAPVRIGPGAVLVVRYMVGGVERLEVLRYPSDWNTTRLLVAGAPAPAAGRLVVLEPGSAAVFEARLEASPDPGSLVVVVFVSPEGVRAVGACRA